MHALIADELRDLIPLPGTGNPKEDVKLRSVWIRGVVKNMAVLASEVSLALNERAKTFKSGLNTELTEQRIDEIFQQFEFGIRKKFYSIFGKLLTRVLSLFMRVL